MKTISYADAYTRTVESFADDFPIIRAFVDDLPAGPVLEVGAGAGRTLKMGLNRELYLVEKDPEMLTILSSRIRDAKYQNGTPHKREIIDSEAANTPLPSNSMAGVFLSINTLAEALPILFTMSEIHRVLMPNGRVLIINENPQVWEKLRTNGLCYSADTEYTYFLRTLPVAGNGPFSFLTEFDVRKNKESRVFSIRQELLTHSAMTSLLEATGFNVVRTLGSFVGEEFNSDSSSIMIIEAEKLNSSLPVAFPFLQEKYDGFAADYDRIVEQAEYAVLPWLLDKTADFRGLSARVLDLGCGNGVIAASLVKQGIYGKFFGIDFSSGMLEAARKRGIYSGLLQMDLSSGFPVVEHNYYDLVVACGFFEFIIDPRPTLKSIISSLAQHGRAYLTFESRGDQSLPEGVHHSPSGLIKYYYTRDELINVLTECGLKVVDLVEGDGYFSPSLKVRIPYLMATVMKA